MTSKDTSKDKSKDKSKSALVQPDSPVAVFGAGPFAKAVGAMVCLTGRPLKVWARDKKQRGEVADMLPSAEVTDDMATAVKDARFIVFAVPAEAVPEVSAIYGEFARGDHVVVHGVRGFGGDTLLAHRAIRSQTRVRLVGALGGPLYFDDLAAGRPLVTVVASRYRETHEAVRAVTAGTPVRVHTSDDITGVEVAGAISNVTHLAVGMADALGLGDTARGVLLTHGLADAERLGIALGASPATFGGLAGIGDLIPRPVRSTERHHEVGAAIVAGRSVASALKTMEGCVEGVATAPLANTCAIHHGVALPLVDAVVEILNGASPEATLEAVLARDISIGFENARQPAR